MVMHAEVGLQGNVLMLATMVPDMGHATPQQLAGRHTTVMVYVDDVDAHHAQAKSAGAKITAELEDKFYGDRMYAAEDPEGHMWYFATHIKDVAPEDMHP